MMIPQVKELIWDFLEVQVNLASATSSGAGGAKASGNGAVRKPSIR